MAESKQHWLDRNRPPRVQITYDVETGNAIEKKEIPFVVGVLSDLGSNPNNPMPKLKDRKFVEIDRDNFNAILAATKPEITVKVADVLKGGDAKKTFSLTFTDMSHFTPEEIVKAVPDLQKLLTARQRLNDLLAKLEGNDELSTALREIMENTDALQKIKDEVTKDENQG